MTDSHYVVSYEITDITNGELKLRSNLTTTGVNPVYLDALRNEDNSLSYLIAANYHGDPDGQVGAGLSTFGINRDCSLNANAFEPSHGGSANPGMYLCVMFKIRPYLH